MARRRAGWAIAVVAAALTRGVAPAAAAPEAAGRTAAVTVGAVPVILDGVLDDAAWERAAPVTMFVQRDPAEGAPATEPTEVRVLYDASAIYVAVRAFDADPDRIVAFLTRRDVGSSSDWIDVYLDSYHDRRTAYQFGVNPAGVKRDAYWFNDNDSDGGWDAIWDVAARRDPDGWCAEFRIPLSQLRFADSGDGRLGFAVVRSVARLNETSSWPLLSKSASGWVSSFGELAGVEVGRASRPLEIVPYTVAEVVTAPAVAGDPLAKSPDPGGAMGLDVRYALTPSLTLSGTVNPDFGQVEADPAVVNLSAFETFFEERRPFFIEGSGVYRFSCRDCTLFYSRRIGRAPRGAPATADGEFSRQPAQSTILGAAKLTGRVRDFSVGVLAAATQEERAEIARGTDRRREVVEPRSWYSVSRVRREFSDQSSLGVILTTTRRQLVESVDFLPETALVGGVDYDWRLGEAWALQGYWTGSHVGGSPRAIERLQRSNVHSFQRPDADHLEVDPLAGTLRGHSGMVSFSQIAGERTRMNFNVGYQSPGFEVNDLGFQQRADVIRQSGWYQIRWNTPGTYTRNIQINFNEWSSRNFGGDRLSRGFNFNAHWQFQNLWGAGFGLNLNAESFDDRLTRGGPGGYGVWNRNAWQYFNTDDRRLVSVNWNSFFALTGDGGRVIELRPGVVVRPVSSFSAEIGFAYVDNLNDAQWIRRVEEAGRTHYAFGRLAQKTSSITARVNYTMTPNLSLQIYAQPFVSAGRYGDYKELVNGRAERYADRYAPYAYPGSADFNVLSFRTTNVLRWEYTPGSTLFVVWQQGREGAGDPGRFALGRNYRDIFATPATNTVLVKIAYWLNP